MMMKSVFWWRKPEYPEETTDLRQVTGFKQVPVSNLIPSEDKGYTNRGRGPRTSLGTVTLTGGVGLGPVWGPLH